MELKYQIWNFTEQPSVQTRWCGKTVKFRFIRIRARILWLQMILVLLCYQFDHIVPFPTARHYIIHWTSYSGDKDMFILLRSIWSCVLINTELNRKFIGFFHTIINACTYIFLVKCLKTTSQVDPRNWVDRSLGGYWGLC